MWRGIGRLCCGPWAARVFSRSGRTSFRKGESHAQNVLAVIGASAVASLLFFFVPMFRQAFHVSLAQWDDIVHAGLMLKDSPPSSGLEALRRKVEQNHDAEGLAFVAVHHPIDSESARLAEEAVRLDPKLIWIYAAAGQYRWLPQIDRWSPKLEKYDPENALSHLITATRVHIDQVDSKKIPHSVDEEPPAWRIAMAAAFQSPKLDDYLDRLKQLDRRVLLRYRIDDPFIALDDYWLYGLPRNAPFDFSHYAKSLLESGDTLEANGDRKGAFENYSAVVQFGQIMGQGGFMLGGEVHDAFMRLASLSEKVGSRQQAQLYAFLAGQADKARQAQEMSFRARFRYRDVSRWNALVVKASGLVLLFSGAILVICALAVAVRGRSLRLTSLHPSHLTLALCFGAAMAALLSSAMLYVTYRPYAEILQRFIRTGGDSGIPELSWFLSYTQDPLGEEFFPNVDFVFYFWFAVVALCLLGLLLAIWRFQLSSRASVTT